MQFTLSQTIVYNTKIKKAHNLLEWWVVIEIIYFFYIVRIIIKWLKLLFFNILNFLRQFVIYNENFIFLVKLFAKINSTRRIY